MHKVRNKRGGLSLVLEDTCTDSPEPSVLAYTSFMPMPMQNLSSMGVLDAPALMQRFVVAVSARLHNVKSHTYE